MNKTWNQWRILTSLVGLLILKVNVSIVLTYRVYFPPNFNSDFLRGREDYFFDGCQWAFWLHIFSGPVSLVLGMLLISTRFRMHSPAWHRRLGRIQAVNVICVLAPSGLWMAHYAAPGPVAGVSFATLAVLTGLTMVIGWRTALERKFALHRCWMLRNLTLLCSAVLLRLVAGAATVFEFGPSWFDSLVAWGCWLVSLALLELHLLRSRRPPLNFTDVITSRNS
ncbi:DUF2306 domain-containing protein [Planctomicrobium sp. SH668]|uniref:DUF2306 domain-containing protein n=1 Tax=Planctomicrobium sp. SH668 TaxID=3448126 RepID=UPI003F5C4580